MGGTSHLPLHSDVPGVAAKGAECDLAQEAWRLACLLAEAFEKADIVGCANQWTHLAHHTFPLGPGAQVFEMC